MNRRDFCICSLGAVSLGAFMHNRSGFALAPKTETSSSLPPIRAITRGPRFHWRGYYDKDLFDPSDRYVLANEIDFEGRTPDANDVLRVGMIDLQNNDAWTELGTTTAWNWQQGCMLQWLPGDKPSVLWNDRQDGDFVSKILDLANRAVKILPMPIYCVSPDGL